MTGLRLARNFMLPLDAITETFGILAVKRAGKSNAAVVMAEEMYAADLPWVAIDPKGDWWGVRAAGEGKRPGLKVLVFGGQHGDVPLEPGSGRLVADLVVEKRITCVLDVSEMTKADQRRFLYDFADRLYRKNTEPLHVFCEEADEYIPQMVRGEMAKVVGAFETLVKRGGFKGIGITLITQRSASLNKDVLTQVGTLLVLRTTSPQDRKAIGDWVKYHAAAEDMLADLSSLGNGEAYVHSPQWLQKLTKIQIRRRYTFDSGSTPKVGGVARPPARLADVDIASITSAMAETIERAKSEDPRELRKEIARLKVEIHRLESRRVEPERIEVSVLTDNDRELVKHVLDTLAQMNREWETKARAIVSHLTGKIESVKPVRISQLPVAERLRAFHAQEAKPAPVTRADNVTVPSDAPPLDKAARSVLAVLAQHPGGRTRSQLALITGYSPKASTLDVALSRLRAAEYVTRGGIPTVTEAGAAVAAEADVEPLPQGDDLLAYWLQHKSLDKAARTILQILIERYPADLSRAEIAELAGYSPSASTIDVGLSRLRKLELVEGFHASQTFMEAIGR